MKLAVNEQRKFRGEEPLTAAEFLRLMREKSAVVELDAKLTSRAVNEGFSGGEKKKNEIFQMAMLDPKLAILDETDSGLDIDALRIVATGVTKLHTPQNATVVITHYQRLLDYIVPDYVHVLYKGRIIIRATSRWRSNSKGGLRLAYQRLQGGVMERLDWIEARGSRRCAANALRWSTDRSIRCSTRRNMPSRWVRAIGHGWSSSTRNLSRRH